MLTVDFGPGTTPPLLTDVQCNGGESSLTDCTTEPLQEFFQTCHAAGVMCAGRRSLRLYFTLQMRGDL